MKEQNYIKLEFPSRSSNEFFARSAVAAFAAQLDPTLEELGDVKTAVSEAVTNAIVHAYPDSIGRIVMRLRILGGNTLEIMVKDFGKGIENVQEAMMDKLRVRSEPGKGTTVVMQRAIRLRVGRR